MSGTVEAVCGGCSKPWFSMTRMPNGEMVVAVERSEHVMVRPPTGPARIRERRIAGAARAYLRISPTLDGDGRLCRCNCGTERTLTSEDLAALYEAASQASLGVAPVFSVGATVTATASFGRPAFRRGGAATP